MDHVTAALADVPDEHAEAVAARLRAIADLDAKPTASRLALLSCSAILDNRTK